MIRLEYVGCRTCLLQLLIVLLFSLSCAKGSDGQQAVTVQSTVVLQNLNNPLQSDVLLITDLDHPLDFRCDVNLENPLPEGYLPAPSSYHWKVASGELVSENNLAHWSHPSPGLQEISVEGELHYLPPKPKGFFAKKLPEIVAPFQASIRCLSPVKVDLIKDGKVNGFEIGRYPVPRPVKADDSKTEGHSASGGQVRRHADVYQPPHLFYEVTPETFRLRIFKEYTLGDFDLDPRFLNLTYPRYIAINPKLLRKLDLLETVVRDQGISLTKFKIFYGFRSPAYNLGARDEDNNKSLKASFSMHMYGMAADMLIDEDNDLVMDDLNGDGTISTEDAKVLYKLVNQLDRTLADQGSDLVGGAGWYYHHDFWERGKIVQSPYVHMDVRGYTNLDGSFVRWVGADTIGVQKQKNPYKPKAPIPPWPW